MKKILLALTTLILSGVAAQAVPIAVTHYNGHNYSLYAGSVSWDAAQADAVQQGGYLAVLNDALELSTVYGALINHGFFSSGGGQGAQAWLGARPADGSFSTYDETNWKWVTNEPWNMAGFFAPGEPNGDSSGLAINRFGTGALNDEGGFVGGYIVETVPEGGSALAFLGLGLCTIGFVRNKLNRKQA